MTTRDMNSQPDTTSLRPRCDASFRNPEEIKVPPFASWTMKGNSTPECTGYVCWLCQFLFHAMQKKYKVEIVVSKELGEIGREVSPGNWTGALGLLHRKEADAYFAIYFLMPELYSVVDFGTAIDGSSFSILSGQPNRLNQKSQSLFSALTWDFCLLLVISWFIVTITYACFSNLECKMGIISSKTSMSFFESFLTFYGLLFQRGFENLPDNISRRILVSGWLFLVVILMVELGGAFSSKLAIQGVPERIDNLEDLMKYPKLLPYVSKGNGLDTFLELSEIETQRKVWKRVLRVGLVGYADLFRPEYMDAVQDGKAVAIGTVEALLKNIVAVDCTRGIRPYYLGKEAIFTTAWANAYRKGLDPNAVEMLNQAATKFGSMGFHQLLWHDISKASIPCFKVEKSRSSYAKLNTKDVLKVFQLLSVGLLLGLASLLGEIGFYSYKTRAYCKRISFMQKRK